MRSPGFDAIVPPIDASAVVHTRSSSRHAPDPLTAGLFLQRSPPRLLTGAACSGLGSPPARRTRRACLHHWHSTVRAGDLLHRLTPLSGRTAIGRQCAPRREPVAVTQREQVWPDGQIQAPVPGGDGAPFGNVRFTKSRSVTERDTPCETRSAADQERKGQISRSGRPRRGQRPGVRGACAES